MKIIPVELGRRSYAIYLKSGLFGELGRLYRRHELGEQVAVITDRTVHKLYGAQALRSLKAAGLRAQLIPVPAGESSKSLAWADRLYERLIRTGVDREATIIALGGGVVGDLAGFVAASYLRGIAFVQLPTTLVGQVDSAIGGKTGLNHRLGKNLIGAYHQPRFVLIDPEFLTSLPPGEWRSGWAEVLKYALIQDAELFAQLEALPPGKVLSADAELLTGIIAHCCRIKASIVSEDEREAGRRELLNFGHTIGHALEAVTGYRRFRHGEAVAWGMLAAAWLSREQGLLAQEPWGRIERLLSSFELPRDLSGCEDEALTTAMRRDKKSRGGQIRLVLLSDIGQAIRGQAAGDAELRRAFGYLRSRAAGS
ncbi:MAG TPA: 3-dehydroquinate synthase [Candidatus Fraserbacteria bacterium]|nr:3-dehydroquinate synthase [Candidatus Fraserbacteria bacterium]